jgi:hypothetical protein
VCARLRWPPAGHARLRAGVRHPPVIGVVAGQVRHVQVDIAPTRRVHSSVPYRQLLLWRAGSAYRRTWARHRAIRRVAGGPSGSCSTAHAADAARAPHASPVETTRLHGARTHFGAVCAFRPLLRHGAHRQIGGRTHRAIGGPTAGATAAPARPTPGVAPAAMQGARHAADCIRRSLRQEAYPTFRYRDTGSLATIGRAATGHVAGPRGRSRYVRAASPAGRTARGAGTAAAVIPPLP